MSTFFKILFNKVVFDGTPPREYGAPLAWGLFVFACRAALSGIFIWYCLDKIADPALFARAIDAYKVLPSPLLINLTALILPWTELIAALCLLFGVLRKGSLLILTGLLVLFEGLFVLTMIRGMKIDCGCSGLDFEVGWLSILRDLVYLIPAVFVFVNDWKISRQAARADVPV